MISSWLGPLKRKKKICGVSAGDLVDWEKLRLEREDSERGWQRMAVRQCSGTAGVGPIIPAKRNERDGMREKKWNDEEKLQTLCIAGNEKRECSEMPMTINPRTI